MSDNSYSTTFHTNAYISSAIDVPLPTFATSLCIRGILPNADGVTSICGDISTNSAAATTTVNATGVSTVKFGSFESFGIYFGNHTIKGSFLVANNELTFTPTENSDIAQDSCVTCILDKSVAGNAQVGQEIRFAQSTTSLKAPVKLGIVEQKTGTKINGSLIVHSRLAGLSFPEVSTFMVSTALKGNNLVIKGGIPLLNSSKTLGPAGSLRIQVLDSFAGSAINRNNLPENKIAQVFLEVIKINPTNGEITVKDDLNIISGAVNTIFTGILTAQGGHALINRLTEMFGNSVSGLNSMHIKANAVTSSVGMASVTVVKAANLGL